MSTKNPLTPAGIEPAAFRFVAEHLNHCATAVPVHTLTVLCVCVCVCVYMYIYITKWDSCVDFFSAILSVIDRPFCLSGILSVLTPWWGGTRIRRHCIAVTSDLSGDNRIKSGVKESCLMVLCRGIQLCWPLLKWHRPPSIEFLSSSSSSSSSSS